MEVMKRMEEEIMAIDKKKRAAYDAKWKKENTVLIGLRLQYNHDMDILQAADRGESRQAEIKRLVRLGLEYERILNEKKTE